MMQWYWLILAWFAVIWSLGLATVLVIDYVSRDTE